MPLRSRLMNEGRGVVVEGIRLGRYNFTSTCSSWVFRMGDALIDSGPPNQWAYLKEYVQRHKIRRLFLSHHHEDHSGNAGKLKDEFGVQVYAPLESLSLLKTGWPMKAYRKILFGKPSLLSAQPFPSEKIQLDGDRTMLPISTPGHSVDHHCFLVPEEGWLFTADLFVTKSPQMCRMDDDPITEMISLKHVLDTYDFDTIYCAHQGKVEHGKGNLQTRYNYFSATLSQVERLYLNDPRMDIKEMTSTILGSEHLLFKTFSGDDFSKCNLITAFYKHIHAKHVHSSHHLK